MKTIKTEIDGHEVVSRKKRIAARKDQLTNLLKDSFAELEDRIAKGIQNKLSEMRPGDSAYFGQRYDDFEKRIKQADEKWLEEMKPYAGRKIVTYHRSWPNFAEHFHLDVVGYVEPRPGIPPSPQHTVELIGLMKRDGVKVIAVEPYFDLKTPNAVARETGGKVVVLMPSVGGEKEVTDYFKLFDYDIAKLKQAFDETK